jgi:hypothetical protein
MSKPALPVKAEPGYPLWVELHRSRIKHDSERIWPGKDFTKFQELRGGHLMVLVNSAAERALALSPLS